MDRLLQFGGGFAAPRPPRAAGPGYDEMMRLLRRDGDTRGLREVMLQPTAGPLGGAIRALAGAPPGERDNSTVTTLAQLMGRRGPETGPPAPAVAANRPSDVGTARFAVLPAPQPAPLPKQVNGRARLLYQRMLQYRLEPEQMAALLGTFEQESSLDPRRVNERSGRRGLAQWDQARWSALERWAKGTRRDPYDAITQLDYALHEMSTVPYERRKAGEAFSRARGLKEAMAAVNAFERWRGWDKGEAGAEAGNRYGLAHDYLGTIEGGLLDP